MVLSRVRLGIRFSIAYRMPLDYLMRKKLRFYAQGCAGSDISLHPELSLRGATTFVAPY